MKIIKFREKDNYVSQQCSMGGDRGGEERPQGEGTADGKQQLRRREEGLGPGGGQDVAGGKSHANSVDNVDINKTRKSE